MAEKHSPIELHRGEGRLRAELEQYGLLLAHDILLPSATRCIAGEPIRGSWWGHPQGSLIYAVLQRVESDVARVKLVAGKSTLVFRSLWPALAAAARARQPWQTANLAPDTLELLRLVERVGSVPADTVQVATARKPVAVVRDLETRLLAFSIHEHTPGGHHVKTLVPFETWQRRMNISDADLPDAAQALETLTAPVRAWVGAKNEVAGLLPWLPPSGRKAGRGRRRP